MEILFGTAGVPLSSRERSTEAGVQRVKELGLDAMEVEFVHGVRMKEEKATKVAKIAHGENISLTCHAPYYINLNSRDQDKVVASKTRLLDTARIAKILGATSIIFHPAFYTEDKPENVLLKVLVELGELRKELDKVGNKVILRPETTGKPSQFGDLQETILLSKEIDGVLPCIDFSHLYARSNGGVNTYDDFCYVLNQIAEQLGDRWTNNAHFHISGIEYGLKGEKRHLIFKDSDLRFDEILKALLTFGIKGTVICESPNIEEDTLLLKQTYENICLLK